jgi:hypothetical protein
VEGQKRKEETHSLHERDVLSHTIQSYSLTFKLKGMHKADKGNGPDEFI